MARKFPCSWFVISQLCLMELHQQYNMVMSHLRFSARLAYACIGYGGFSISVDPFFSENMLTLAQKYGFILAVPNIRGGGEFGEEWHLAGCLEKKVRCSTILYFVLCSNLFSNRKIVSTTSFPRRKCFHPSISLQNDQHSYFFLVVNT